MKKYSKITFITLVFSLSITAQKNIEKGDRYYDQNQFEEAIKYYALDIKSDNRKAAEYALKRLADCYRISGEFEKAEETYKKILKRKNKDPQNYLNYGLSLKSSAKYAEAIKQFEEYIKLKPDDKLGPIFLLSCDSAQKWLDETIGKEVKNIKAINTSHSEFSPYVRGDQFYFSSSREGSTHALISFDGGGDIHRLDVYNVSLVDLENKTLKKSTIQKLKSIDTPLHEGTVCFSSNGKEIYFTKTVKGIKDNYANSILGTLQVYKSTLDTNGIWTKPVSAFDFNSFDYSVGHPSLSSGDSIIYFMSDMPGGFGKTDIYLSKRQKDGSWAKPINAGNQVNTFGFELFPTISENNELYFSSNAHPGMGQLDIFKAELVNSTWTNVHNLKPPINSIGNDFGIIMDGKDNRGFFSSDRFNGLGAEDIYSFSEDVPLELTLAGDSILFNDKAIYDDIKYKLINITDSIETELISLKGIYHFKLLTEKHYELRARKNGMPYNKIIFSTERDTLYKETKVTIRSETKDIYITLKNENCELLSNDSKVELPIETNSNSKKPIIFMSANFAYKIAL